MPDQKSIFSIPEQPNLTSGYKSDVMSPEGVYNDTFYEVKPDAPTVPTNEEFAQSISMGGPTITDLINQVHDYQAKSDQLLANFPKTPQTSGIGFNPDAAAQQLQNALNPKKRSIASYNKPMYLGQAKDFERYASSENFQTFGYSPFEGQEQEFKYGRAMSWGDTIGNALGGAYHLASDTFVEGWKGWGRMAEALFTWDASKLMGSPEERYEMAKQQEAIMNKYAIYDTEESKDSIWNRQFFGTMLQQSGFAVGAGLQFALEEVLTGGVATFLQPLTKGFAIGRALKNTEKVGELINDTRKVMETVTNSKRVTNTFSKFANSVIPLYGSINNMSKMYKAGAGFAQLGMIGLGGLKRSLSEFNMARSESIFEAAGTYKQLYDGLVEEHYNKYGVLPEGETLEKMKQTAEDASHDNFWTNVGVLSVMNRIQFDNMFKSFGKTRKIFNETATSLEGRAFEVAGKIAGKQEKRVFKEGLLGRVGAYGDISKTFGRKTAMWEATKGLGKGLMKFEGSEGMQELIQEASSAGLTEYYSDLYHGKKGYGSKLDATLSNIENPLTSTEGMKTFLMGALTGRLISPFGMTASRLINRKEFKELNEKTEEAVGLLNAFYQNPANFKKEWIANVKVQNKAAETMDEAAKNYNRYVYNNHKESAFAKSVGSAIKLNMFESMRDTIKEYGEQMSDEEFKAAFDIDPTKENKKNVKNFMNEIGNQMDDYFITFNNLKDKYGDKILPELYKNNSPEEYLNVLYSKTVLDDAIEILTTNVYKSRQAVKRASQLQTEIGQNKNIGSSSIEMLTKLGSKQAIQEHIDLLESEIKNLQDPNIILSKEQKEILKDKKEELNLAKTWQSSYEELTQNIDESYSPTAEGRAYDSFASLVNLFNKRNKITATVSKDDIDDNFIKINDYIRLNEDHKSYVDAMNLLADPRNLKLVTNSMISGIKEMKDSFKKEHEDEIRKETGVKQLEEPATPKTSITITSKDKNGKEVTFQIKEGESYITEATPEKRIYKGKIPKVYYDQDIIKIISINEGGISFTYNDEKEVVTMSVEEFSEIGKLYPLSEMTPHQRIYFKNRNVIFDLNVYAKTGKPHYNKGRHATQDYSSSGIIVKARLELVKEEDGEYALKIVYVNPVTKLKESIYYDADYLKKYALNKKDLFDITESEGDVLNKRTEARRFSQIKMLEEAIAELMSKKDKTIESNIKNEEDYNKIKKELEDYVAELELIEEEFRNKPYVSGEKSKDRIELEERKEVLENLIKNAKTLVEKFQEQAEQFKKEIQILNELLDYYSEGIQEIEETGQPFTMTEGKIYTAEEQELERVKKQQIIKPSRNISLDDVNSLLDETELELELVNERISILQNMIDYSNKLLGRIAKVTDLIDVLINVTDKKQLLNQLLLMKRQEQDADNKKTIQNLINLINKGNSLELAYTFELIDRLVESKEELSSLLEDANNLQDKFDRLTLAKEQKEAISRVERRFNMLKAIQEGIIRGHKLALEKQGIKKEGSKVITKVNAAPVQDDIIKGSDALFTTEPILDIVPDSEEEKETFKQVEGFAPVLDENALFKTAGRHFLDRNDTQLTSPQEARFFKFSETARLSSDVGTVFYLMPITKDSKEFQELRSKGFSDDIRLVVVKRDAMGNFKPVGMDGNILQNPTEDNMIYTGMHGSPELLGDNPDATYEWLKNNFAIYDKKTKKDRVTKEEALRIASDFKQVREVIKEKVKAGETVVLPIIDKSPGIYNREPLVGGYDEKGNPTPQRPQELSLEGRLIEDNPDFTNLKHPDGRSVQLEISKNNTRVKSGRVMVVRSGEPPIVVYNRKFTKDEQNNIIDILKRLSDLFIQKNTETGLTEEQSAEFKTCLRYLQGVLYWSPVEEGKEPSPFQIFVKNGLNIGKQNIPFTADSIELNKDKITEVLQYHKVNNTLLNDKNKSEAFYDVKVIDGKVFKGKQYVNYQHYLLADRPGGSVLYTNIKPYTPASANKIEAQNYQLKNVYLKYDVSDYVSRPTQDINDEETLSKNIKQYSINQVERVINGVKFFLIENNTPKEGKVTFVTKRKNGDDLYLHTEYKNGKYEIFQVIDEKGEDLTNVDLNGKTAKEQYQNGLARSIDKQLELLEDNETVSDNNKGFQSEVIESFAEVFIRIEEYAKQGEVMNDVKSSEILTAPVVTPVSISSVEDKKKQLGLQNVIQLYEPTQSDRYYHVTVKGEKKEFLAFFEDGRWNLFVKDEKAGGYSTGGSDPISPEKAKENVDKYLPKELVELMEESGKQNTWDKQRAFEKGRIADYVALYRKEYLKERIPIEEDVLNFYKSDKYPNKSSQESVVKAQIELINKLKTELATLEAVKSASTTPVSSIKAKNIGVDYVIENKEITVDHPKGETATPIIDYQAASKEFYEGTKVKVLSATADIVEAQVTYPDGDKFTETFDRTDFENKVFKLTSLESSVSTTRSPKVGDKLTSDSNTKYIIRGFADNGGIQFESSAGGRGVWAKDTFDQYIKEGRLKYDDVESSSESTVGKTMVSTGKTFDDFVNEKYKQHVTDARSQGSIPISKNDFASRYAKQLKLQYDNTILMSADDIIKNGLAAAEDDYDPNTRFAEITSDTKPEDIEKFKQWLQKNLPQIKLEILDELIDGKYMGQFVNGMIRMYKSAEEGTGFHEAFEAVWNAFLTPEKQQVLLNEFKKRKDYKYEPSYLWASANYKTNNEDRLIKEALAEEFREYMLKEGSEVKAESPKRNTFFRKLWNWIKQLFGLNKEKVDEIQSETEILFGQIAKGEFKDSIPVQNYDPTIAHNRAAISETSVEFTQQLMEGLTAIFFSKLNTDYYKDKGYSIEKMFDENNNIFEELFKASWSTLYNRFMPGLKEIMKSDAFQFASPEKQKEIIEKYRNNRISEDEKIGSNLFYQKMRAVNQGIYNTEVKAQFKNYLSQFGLKFKQVEDKAKSEEEIAEIEGKEEKSNTLGLMDVIYVDPTSLTNPAVRLLILSLPNNLVNDSGKASDIRNKLNLPSLVPYKRKMNILLNELSNVVPMMRKQEDGTFKKTSALEEMFEKLDKKFKDPVKFKYKEGYEWINTLKSRLKFNTLKNGGELSNDDIKLIVSFETSFTRNKNNPLKIIVGADGKLRHVNAVSVNTKEKIREEWRNAIKDKAYKVDISKLDKGGILYISPNNIIEINLSSPRINYITGASDIRGQINAFKDLGITLSNKIENLSEDDKKTIEKAYKSLKYVIDDAVEKNKSIKYDTLFGNELIGGPLNSLLALELKFRSEDTLLSHQTAEGKTQYAITPPSEISYVLDSLNNANSLEEFVMSNPQYGKVVNGVIVLNPYNSTSELLSPGGIIFDIKGRKREKVLIEYEYISGMSSDKESDGENTDKLNFNDKIVQEIYHLLRGSYFTVINSDKSSEYAIKMGHFVKWTDITEKTPDQSMNFIEDKYINALKAEVLHALRFHFYPNNIQNHQSRILSLGHFSNIPGLQEGSNLHNYFLRLVKEIKITKETKVENASMIFEAIAENFTSTVKNQGVLKEYINSQVEETKAWLINKEIVKPVEVTVFGKTLSRYKALGIPRDSDAIKGLDTKEMSDSEFTQLTRFLVVNRQLAVYEQHKLFYGHPALYKDLAKRSSGANSQKNVISENPDVIQWMEKNKPRYDGRVRDIDNPIMRSMSYADPKVTSPHVKYIAEQLFKDISTKIDKKKAEELIGAKFNEDGSFKSIVGGKGTYISGYINMDEADGQAKIMPDYFRDMLYLSGMLSKEQEDFLDYENALEIKDRSDESHPYYNEKWAKDDILQNNVKQILSKPKPEAILQVLKPQGFGFQNTDGMSHINLLKNSVFPLTWSRVKNNPDMMSKYIDAKNQGVDIIDFGSGHKVGVMTNSDGKLTPFYNQDGTISTDIPLLQDIFSKYFGVQVQTPDYAKNAVIFGSQVRKLILSDLPESLKQYSEEYKNVLNALLDIERKDLLNELGLKQNDKGKYEIESLESLIQTLRDEAIKRDLPDNVIEMLDTIIVDGKEDLKYPFDANPAREKIESVINSLVDNRIIRTEMFGKANVQVASTLFSRGRNLLYLKDGVYESVKDFSKLSEDDKKRTVLSSTNLNFYNGEKPYIEVYVPWYFKDGTPEQAGFKLNSEGIWMPPEGKDLMKLLSSIGFRIPTQGLNSIDSIVIKGFLDPSYGYGDMVVVPSEMVGKSGSDFDIDKLNMFLANYYVANESGEIVYIPYSTSDSELNNRYFRFINDSVDSDTKRYVATLEKYSGEKSNLQDKYDKNKDVIFSKFKDARKQYSDQYEEAQKEIFKIAENSRTNDTLLKEYKKRGYSLFKTLPQSIKQPFYDLKDEGVVSVAENKALAERLLEANPKAKYSSTLMQMIQYHEAMLDIYAQINNWTNEQLNALNDRANASFGKWENWKEENLGKTREEFLKSLKEYRVEYIGELARVSGLPTLEEFKKLPIEKQNSKKALQNRVLEIMKTIVEHPDNQRQLLTPNSSAKLKKLSEYILELKGIKKDETNMTKLSEWITMSETRETFITSKQLVGIGALQITSHAMSQIGEVELTGTYTDFNGTLRQINIKLPNSNTNKLNLTVDADGMYIFDLFNEALTGSVDAAKDPFIFDIRLNLETASTWFYLTKRGVSQENIALMFNQPIMDDYFKFKDANDTFVNIANDEKEYFNNIIVKAASYYYTQATGQVIDTDEYPDKILALFKQIQNSFKNYTSKELSEAISTKKLSKQQNLMQIAILMDMLDYKTQADKLSNFIRAISYDTTKTKNIVENHLQQLRYKRAINDEFIKKDTLYNVFDRTFLGKVKELKDDVLNMFEKFFVTLDPKSKVVFEPLLEKLDDDMLFMSNTDKADLLNRYQNFFITHILQNTSFGKDEKISKYFNLFSDGKKESLAKRLKKLKDKYPDNQALKNLFPIVNENRFSTDNIKMFNNKMSSYDINLITQSIETLHKQSEQIGDFDLKEFIENLSRFAILQSGVQLNPVTFTKVLPLSLYAELTSEIFKNYINSQDVVDVNQIWKAFHQNNYKNNKIVPKQKYSKKTVIKDGLLVIRSDRSRARNQYIKIYIPIEGASEKAKFNERFALNLYERIKITDATGKDVTLDKSVVKYRPINKLGNGMYLVETTPDPLTDASRFEINGDVNESMYDEAVMTWRKQVSLETIESGLPEFDKLPGRSSTRTMTYAGIGSRQTPQEVLDAMTQVAKYLDDLGYTLNTGKTYPTSLNDYFIKTVHKGNKQAAEEAFKAKQAETERLTKLYGNKVGMDEEGADRAFSAGASKKNLFGPMDKIGDREMKIAEEIHPNWSDLSSGAAKLMARNTNQVFGANLDKPVDFVLFYAEETDNPLRPKGGTGQAVEMARRKSIPTINMANPNWRQELDRVLSGGTQPAVSGPSAETKINIYAGTGENTELSNFAFRPFIDPITEEKFETVEGAFQAHKLYYSNITGTENNNALTNKGDLIFVKLQTAKGNEAKKIGTDIKGLDTKKWDDNSSKIMKDLLKASFEQNPDALAKLLATGNATLTHMYEGVEQDKGRFSRLLMEVREELRSKKAPTTGAKTMKLKNGVTYGFSAINAKMLEEMGYTPQEIGKLLKSIC